MALASTVIAVAVRAGATTRSARVKTPIMKGATVKPSTSRTATAAGSGPTSSSGSGQHEQPGGEEGAG